MMKLYILLIALLLSSTTAFRVASRSVGVIQPMESSTRLHAHHVNKKITKRMMSRRPKKHRPSDINRNNVNMDKCITKVADAPAEYTLMSAADYEAKRTDALKFWENGDSEAEWITFTPEDMDLQLARSVDPLPEGGVQKNPNLARSGSA